MTNGDRRIETTGTRPSTRRAWLGPMVLGGVLVLASAWPAQAPTATDAQEPAAYPAPARRAPRQRRGESLEDRVRALSKALDLDARQETELKKVLVAQREETLKAWADESVPAAVRVKATELISQRTADRIRALLNEQQRTKYNPPRVEHEPAPGSSGRTVEEWMNPPRTGKAL